MVLKQDSRFHFQQKQWKSPGSFGATDHSLNSWNACVLLAGCTAFAAMEALAPKPPNVRLTAEQQRSYLSGAFHFSKEGF